MDAQDFRSLQEAYMEVVMREGKVPWNDPKSPLESGHTPAEKNRAKRERTGVEDLSKSPTDKQYARYGDMKSADDEQSSASKRKDKPTHKFRDLPIRTDKGKKQTLGQLRRTRGTPKPGASDEKSNLYQSPIRKDDKRTRGGKTDQWKGPNPRNEEIELYDIILSHLLDEGYAETLKAAEAIMVNMSEEWREDIMEKEDSEYEKASDAALDKRYGYGRASGDKRSFGRAANRSSAAAALRALRSGKRSGSGTSTEAGADAVHQGWAKTAKTSTDQTPEKKERRSKLANTEYKDLPDDEKEKDRVSFNAVKATYKNRNR